MSDGMLLGIDEGTTGVKAALFDSRLRPVAETRRDKVNRHPEEGWVEQDGEEVIAAVTDAVGELLSASATRWIVLEEAAPRLRRSKPSRIWSASISVAPDDGGGNASTSKPR